MFFWQPLAAKEVWLGSSLRLWSPAKRLHKPAAIGMTKGCSWYSPSVLCVSPCATQKAIEILTKLYRFTAQRCTAVTPQSFSESALEKGGQRQVQIIAVSFEQGSAGQSSAQNQRKLSTLTEPLKMLWFLPWFEREMTTVEETCCHAMLAVS